MYKLSLIDPNFRQGPKEVNAYFLPYSVGILWSFCRTSEVVKNSFELDKLVWRREDIETLAQDIKNNDVVGFSCYIWNWRYNQGLAKRLKELNPNILIVFGGPQVPVEREDLFDDLPFVDIVVKTEGEITLRNILACYARNEPYSTVPGIKINGGADTGDSVRIQDLDVIPSPYLTGVFDDIMRENKDVNWNALLETNRGCPYQCTFCDWGSLTYSKVKKFDLNRVLDEIDWFGKNNIDYLNFCDANFGIFPERDAAIAQKYMDVQAKYGTPKNYDVSWAKNQRAQVLEIAKILNSGKTSNALHISLQSLDDEVLDTIKRKNLEVNKIEDMFKACEELGIPVFSEMILGLPRETLESWKNNYYRLYKVGNNPIIAVYRSQLLENAEMNLTQKNLYKIESKKVHDYFHPDENNSGDLQESVEVVVSTLDLPKDKMLEAQMWSWYQATFHVNGLTNYLSRFLNEYCGVTYADFYENLYDLLYKDEWFAKEYLRVSTAFKVWENTGEMITPCIDNVRISMLNINNSTTMALYDENRVEHIMKIIDEYMQRFKHLFDDEVLFDELLEFQRNYTIKYEDLHKYPIKKTYKNDFISFLVGKELKSPVTLLYNFTHDPKIIKKTFIEQITFGRRRNFGKASIERI